MSDLTFERIDGIYMNLVYEHIVLACERGTFRPINVYIDQTSHYMSRFGPTEYEIPIVLLGEET